MLIWAYTHTTSTFCMQTNLLSQPIHRASSIQGKTVIHASYYVMFVPGRVYYVQYVIYPSVRLLFAVCPSHVVSNKKGHTIPDRPQIIMIISAPGFGKWCTDDNTQTQWQYSLIVQHTGAQYLTMCCISHFLCLQIGCGGCTSIASIITYSYHRAVSNEQNVCCIRVCIPVDNNMLKKKLPYIQQ